MNTEEAAEKITDLFRSEHWANKFLGSLRPGTFRSIILCALDDLQQKLDAAELHVVEARGEREKLRKLYAGTLGEAMNLEAEVKRLQGMLDKVIQNIVRPLSEMPEQLPERVRERLTPGAIPLDAKLNLLRTVAVRIGREVAKATRAAR